MDFEKYTDRAKGFVQSAQMGAMRDGHPQLGPEHLLKVLLEDTEGLCSGLIQRAGGDAKEALRATELSLGKLPKVSGAAALRETLPVEAAVERLRRNLDQFVDRVLAG